MWFEDDWGLQSFRANHRAFIYQRLKRFIETIQSQSIVLGPVSPDNFSFSPDSRYPASFIRIPPIPAYFPKELEPMEEWEEIISRFLGRESVDQSTLDRLKNLEIASLAKSINFFEILAGVCAKKKVPISVEMFPEAQSTELSRFLNKMIRCSKQKLSCDLEKLLPETFLESLEPSLKFRNFHMTRDQFKGYPDIDYGIRIDGQKEIWDACNSVESRADIDSFISSINAQTRKSIQSRSKRGIRKRVKKEEIPPAIEDSSEWDPPSDPFSEEDTSMQSIMYPKEAKDHTRPNEIPKLEDAQNNRNSLSEEELAKKYGDKIANLFTQMKARNTELKAQSALKFRSDLTRIDHKWSKKMEIIDQDPEDEDEFPAKEMLAQKKNEIEDPNQLQSDELVFYDLKDIDRKPEYPRLKNRRKRQNSETSHVNNDHEIETINLQQTAKKTLPEIEQNPKHNLWTDPPQEEQLVTGGPRIRKKRQRLNASLIII